MSCPVNVSHEKLDKNKRPVGYWTVRRCGKKSHTVFRVGYSELKWNNYKFDDMFGICSHHLERFQDVNAWNVKLPANPNNTWSFSVISKLRGTVGSLEVIDSAGSAEDKQKLIKENRTETKVSDIKASLKKLMDQGNTKMLSVDDWRRIFDESLNEWVVGGVQNS